MTARLENAIRQLPPEKLEELTKYAEFLADRLARAQADKPSFLQLGWRGAAAELAAEYPTGVHAAHAASSMIAENVERKLER